MFRHWVVVKWGFVMCQVCLATCLQKTLILLKVYVLIWRSDSSQFLGATHMEKSASANAALSSKVHPVLNSLITILLALDFLSQENPDAIFTIRILLVQIICILVPQLSVSVNTLIIGILKIILRGWVKKVMQWFSFTVNVLKMQRILSFL